MWRVKSLKVYHFDCSYLAYVNCVNGGITKVRLKKKRFRFLFMTIQTFRKSFNTLVNIPMPDETVNIESFEEVTNNTHI